MHSTQIVPLPNSIGVGFSSYVPHPLYEQLFRYEQVGVYHNYYFTKENYRWPKPVFIPKEAFIIDGFSPNLNKFPHVGHLRNLAVAKSISEIFANAQMAALLGTSLGEIEGARKEFIRYCSFLKYHPLIYTSDMMEDSQSDAYRKVMGLLKDGEGEFEGCKIYEGPRGDVVAIRSNGKPTYLFHDLMFKEMVHPTHYITGCEQQEHFKMLGLDKEHHQMGLVLGTDGKKLKSRDGLAMLASEMIGTVLSKLDTTPHKEELAWNILAWNLLKISIETNAKLDLDNLVNPNSGGMYISYVYARIASVFNKYGYNGKDANLKDLTESDIGLIGQAEYYTYYLQRAIDMFDPAPIANFALELAKILNQAYHHVTIKDAPPSTQYAIMEANKTLKQTMEKLGMFILEIV